MAMVDALKIRPDIRDYYGNLPLYYALKNNHVDLIQKIFKKGRDYFNIRNYCN
jgi:ankyrin repeat protein